MTQTLKAKRLPIHPGPAAWNELLPPQGKADQLVGHVTADIAIVGAGFAGLSAARRLRQIDPTLSVVILEAGRVAEGPAGRNSGFMIDLPHDLSSETYAGDTMEKDRIETGLNRQAIAFAANVAQENQLALDVFNPSGKINAAATSTGDTHNREYAVHLANMGETHELLDTQQMAELTGISHYVSGLYTPGTAIMQPAAYIRALADSLRSSCKLYEQSPVLQMKRQADSWQLESKQGSVMANKVILAVNGHAESFGLFKRRLLHVFTYASMTKPIAKNALAGQPTWGVTPADPMGTTVRRINGENGSRIVVRSRFTYNPSMTVSDSGLASAGKLHDQKFADRFPMLAGTEMDYRWAGHMCLSLNSVPAHGEVEPGLFSAACQNGLGVAKGTLAGISAAELVMQQESDITRSMLGMAAPKKLPPEPLTWLGANLRMRWSERRAKRE